MRISPEYINVFVASISKFINTNENVELRLFGSRVNDELKGGDIDLLLITESLELANLLRQNKVRIFANIFMKLEEQKIDLLITDKNNIDEPFVKKAFKESVLIYQWNESLN